MIFKKRERKKAVIFLSDTSLRYLVLSRVKNIYHIKHHDSIDLKPGVIKDNEILELDFLSKILSDIKNKIQIKNIDVLMPHDFFKHEKIFLDVPYSSRRKMKRFFYKHVVQDIKKYSWISTHSFEIIFYKTNNRVEAHLQMLKQENYRALEYAFDKAGFKIHMVHSEDFTFRNIFSKDLNTLHVRVGVEFTNVSIFKSGIYHSSSDFGTSYQSLESIIRKYSLEYKENASQALQENGLRPLYKDTGVSSKMIHSFHDLIHNIKNNLDEFDEIKISFESFEIPGLIDLFKKNFKKDISLVNPVRNGKYTFDDVLPIHHNDLSEYTTCILYLLGK